MPWMPLFIGIYWNNHDFSQMASLGWFKGEFRSSSGIGPPTNQRNKYRCHHHDGINFGGTIQASEEPNHPCCHNDDDDDYDSSESLS